MDVIIEELHVLQILKTDDYCNTDQIFIITFFREIYTQYGPEIINRNVLCRKSSHSEQRPTYYYNESTTINVSVLRALDRLVPVRADCLLIFFELYYGEI